MTKISVPLPAIEELLPIARQFNLHLIVLFGSVARGSTNVESDVDLGVLTKHALTFDQRLELWSALSPLFPLDVDLTVLNHVDPVFGFELARDGKVLFESEPYVWENWKSYKVRQYWDTEKFREDLKRYIARCAEEMRYAAVE